MTQRAALVPTKLSFDGQYLDVIFSNGSLFQYQIFDVGRNLKIHPFILTTILTNSIRLDERLFPRSKYLIEMLRRIPEEKDQCRLAMPTLFFTINPKAPVKLRFTDYSAQLTYLCDYLATPDFLRIPGYFEEIKTKFAYIRLGSLLMLPDVAQTLAWLFYLTLDLFDLVQRNDYLVKVRDDELELCFQDRSFVPLPIPILKLLLLIPTFAAKLITGEYRLLHGIDKKSLMEWTGIDDKTLLKLVL